MSYEDIQKRSGCSRATVERCIKNICNGDWPILARKMKIDANNVYEYIFVEDPLAFAAARDAARNNITEVRLRDVQRRVEPESPTPQIPHRDVQRRVEHSDAVPMKQKEDRYLRETWGDTSERRGQVPQRDVQRRSLNKVLELGENYLPSQRNLTEQKAGQKHKIENKIEPEPEPEAKTPKPGSSEVWQERDGYIEAIKEIKDRLNRIQQQR